ncbi:MAG: ferrous iron transport protein A [Desulfurococcales archaeon]|nr:ferrous iron transport protein A [Desulfurococcales archaeon]
MAWAGWGRGRGWWGRGPWPRWGPQPPTRELLELDVEAFPLSMAKPGDKVVVKAIMAGQGAYYRALSLGIAPGTTIEVVENTLQYPWSPIIIKVRGVEIALGRGMAHKIIVARIVNEEQTSQGASKEENQN